MTTFTRTWNSAYEAQPADVEDLGLGASRIRQLKNDIKERLEVDHSWAGDADDGHHKVVLFHAPQGSDPTTGANRSALYTKDVSAKAELHWKDEDGNVVQLTNGGQINLFPAGTKMLFQQTSAPIGWTKETTDVNDKALRVVSGTVGSGGTDAFSTVFASGKTTESHALTVDEIPAHGHPFRKSNTNETSTQSDANGGFISSTQSNVNYPAHDGAVSATNGEQIGGTGGGSGHTHDITMDLQYIDVIIATKD